MWCEKARSCVSERARARWGRLRRGRRAGMAGIVMQEEKVRQCKVFVVLMQRQHSCWGTSDAAAGLRLDASLEGRDGVNFL